MRTSSRSAPEICVHAGDRLLPFTPPRQEPPSYVSSSVFMVIRLVSLALLLLVPWAGCFYLMAQLTRLILIPASRRACAQLARVGALSARHKAHNIGPAQRSGARLS